MSGPVVEHEDVVRPEWIDSNGHMNLAYYVVVFDLATDNAEITALIATRVICDTLGCLVRAGHLPKRPALNTGDPA